MKNLIIFVITLLNSVLVLSQQYDSLFVDGRLIIRLEENTSLTLIPFDSTNIELLTAFAPHNNIDITKPFDNLTDELERTYRVTFSDYETINNFLSDIQGIDGVEFVEKEPLMFPTFIPNDPHFELQWYLNTIDAPLAWDISAGTATIKLAIVDNAVSTQHEDLVNQIYINPNESQNIFDDDLNGFINDYNGWDVADDDNDPNPPSSAGSTSPFVHGTHCAGIAAGETNNNKGIAGVSEGIKIIPVKCSPDNSNGEYLTNAYDGVYYAIQAGADVVSMSFGGTGGIFITGQSIIDAAASAGIVLVAAAGNDNSTENFYPAAYSNVIAVGATDDQDKKATFSNYGSYLDIMAPGVGIYSTLSGNGSQYNYSSGTSMACPIVAGVAAMILRENPSLNRSQVKEKLFSSSEDISSQNPTYDGLIGQGRVNLFNALYEVINDTNWPGEQMEVHLFPTLVQNEQEIKIISIYELESMLVYDVNGKLVFSKQMNNETNYTFQLNTLKSGMYFVKILTKKGWEIKKITLL